MASLYLQFGDNTEVDPELGFALLNHNVGVTEVNEDIVIQAEKQFLYYNKRFTKALNNGTISQALYDDIIAQQNEARQVFTFNTNIDTSVLKQPIIDLVAEHSVQNVDIGGTTAEIVEDIIIEGYQIVKKI